MNYELIDNKLYTLDTGQVLKTGNSYLYKPGNLEGVLINLPTLINFKDWTSTLKDFIEPQNITYIIIQTFNPDFSQSLNELKSIGVDATIICHKKNALYNLYPWKVDSSWEFISQTPTSFSLDGNDSFTVQENPYLLGSLDLITIIPKINTFFSGSLFSAITEDKKFDNSDKAWFSIVDFYRSFVPTFQGFQNSHNQSLMDKIKVIAPERGPIIEINGFDFIETLKKYESKRTENTIINSVVNPLDEKQLLLTQPLNINVFKFDYLNTENKKDLDLNNLKHKLAETSIDQITNPNTELFNELFFKKFMTEELEDRIQNKKNGCCLYVQLNDKDYLTTAYDSETMNRIFKNLAREFEIFIEETEDRFKHRLFHLNRDILCYYIPEGKIEYFLYIAEKLQIQVKESTIFTELLSISIGIVTFDELHEGEDVNPYTFIHDRGMFRLNSALRKDSSHINFDIIQDDFVNKDLNPPLVVLITADSVFSGVMSFHLKSQGFIVKEFSDCLEAYKYIDTNIVKLIISDLYLEKLDGLSLKEKLNEKLKLRKIPFILNTSIKTDEIIIRSHSLNIKHIFSHPVSLVEITGLSKLLVEVITEEHND